VKLYIEKIEPIVLNEDISRPYVYSSPSNGIETVREGGLSPSPQDPRFGDVHYYNYDSNSWDWTIYPSAKFASEYGFQSYPSLQTLSKAIDLKDMTYPLSAAMIHRQHHAMGDQEMEKLIANYMKLPIAGGSERLNDLIYLSQIAQAMSIKTETEFYRRNRAIDPLSGEGFTMGALYWQLNDIWQAPSWSSIEFGGKWKILHYFAKNMFENLLISPYEDNHVLKIAVVRDDYSGSVPLNMSIKVFKWSSIYPIYEINKTITTSSFSSQLVYQNSVNDILLSANCQNRDYCLIEVSVENVEKGWHAFNFMFLNPLKNAVGIKKPNLRVTHITDHQIFPPNYVYDIVLESDGIAPFVWLDFRLGSDIEGIFSDNGFVMFGNKKLIQFYGQNPVSIDKLKSELTVKSLTDIKSE
jgi:beta-mannosidase